MIRKSKGFTLIEILLVLSLLGAVSLAAMTVFIQGVRIFDRMGGVLDEQEKAFYVERLTRDLKSSLRYSSIPWVISKNQMVFATIAPVSMDESLSVRMPLRVSYEFNFDKREIIRKESRFPYSEFSNVQTVASDIASLDFSALRDSEESSPSRVTVAIEYGSDGATKSLKKHISIPVGYKPAGSSS